MGVRRCLARSLTSLALMRTPKSANGPRSNSFRPDSPLTTPSNRGRKTQSSPSLKHCILAHHGELEYGSPKKPALMEALALAFADNTDAKLETMTELLKKAGDNTQWLGFNRLLESNVRKTTV